MVEAEILLQKVTRTDPSPKGGGFTFSKEAAPTLHSEFRNTHRSTDRTDSNSDNPYQDTDTANSAAKT